MVGGGLGGHVPFQGKIPEEKFQELSGFLMFFGRFWTWILAVLFLDPDFELSPFSAVTVVGISPMPLRFFQANPRHGIVGLQKRVAKWWMTSL